MANMESALAIVRRKDLEVVLWAHTAADPRQREWNAALRTIVDHLHFYRAPRARLRILIVTDGGLPNVRQRAELDKALCRGERRPIAVITPALSNLFKRWLADSFTRANPSARFFEPAQTESALQHLDLPGEFPRLWPTLLEVQEKTGSIRTLQHMARGMNSSRFVNSEPRSGIFRTVASVADPRRGAVRRGA